MQKSFCVFGTQTPALFLHLSLSLSFAILFIVNCARWTKIIRANGMLLQARSIRQHIAYSICTKYLTKIFPTWIWIYASIQSISFSVLHMHAFNTNQTWRTMHYTKSILIRFTKIIFTRALQMLTWTCIVWQFSNWMSDNNEINNLCLCFVIFDNKSLNCQWKHQSRRSNTETTLPLSQKYTLLLLNLKTYNFDQMDKNNKKKTFSNQRFKCFFIVFIWKEKKPFETLVKRDTFKITWK